MNLAAWLSPPVLGLTLLFLFTLLFLYFRYRSLNKTQPSGLLSLRELGPFHKLLKSMGRALENGKGIHLSTGSGGVSGIRGASGLIGLVMLSRIVLKSAKNDLPPQATSGDGILTALAQDTMHQSYTATGSQRNFDPSLGQVTGITPFSYAAGAMLAAADHPLEANLLAGHFGPEAALIVEAADRSAQLTISGSDSLPAQATLLATADEILIGEELFAGGAYLQADPAHQASLAAQDTLRWLIILLILAGVTLKLLGVL
jgi:hypothetical protein